MLDRAGRTDLHYCGLEGTAEQARDLLDAGLDPNLQDQTGFTPLHFAAQQRNVAVAEVLLAAGAKVDIQNKFGNTPLWVAVSNSQGEGEMIMLLREAGADPLKENASGISPVMRARGTATFDKAQYFSDLP